MTPEAKLQELRALRDRAWAIVREDLAELEAGIEDRGLGERVKDRAAAEARQAWEQTLDVASEHKGVVAATLLALAAWFLRGPLGRALERLFGDEAEPEADENADACEGDIP